MPWWQADVVFVCSKFLLSTRDGTPHRRRPTSQSALTVVYAVPPPNSSAAAISPHGRRGTTFIFDCSFFRSSLRPAPGRVGRRPPVMEVLIMERRQQIETAVSHSPCDKRSTTSISEEIERLFYCTSTYWNLSSNRTAVSSAFPRTSLNKYTYPR